MTLAEREAYEWMQTLAKAYLSHENRDLRVLATAALAYATEKLDDVREVRPAPQHR